MTNLKTTRCGLAICVATSVLALSSLGAWAWTSRARRIKHALRIGDTVPEVEPGIPGLRSVVADLAQTVHDQISTLCRDRKNAVVQIRTKAGNPLEGLLSIMLRDKLALRDVGAFSGLEIQHVRGETYYMFPGADLSTMERIQEASDIASNARIRFPTQGYDTVQVVLEVLPSRIRNINRVRMTSELLGQTACCYTLMATNPLPD